MSFSNEEQAKMQATAGGPAMEQSLAEGLQAQLDRAIKKQEKFDAYEPTAMSNADSIGSMESRAFGEAPSEVRQRGISAANNVAARSGEVNNNVLSIMTQLMGLEKQRKADEQKAADSKLARDQFNAELMEKGMILDPDTLEPRGATDAEREEYGLKSLKEAEEDADPIAWLKKQPGGERILAAMPVAGMEGTAQAVKDLGIEQYVRNNPEMIWTKAEEASLTASKDILQSAEDALALFNDDKENPQAPGVGTFSGRVHNKLTSQDGKDMRRYLAHIDNQKIKEMSGAAVSDQEAQRLATELPNANDTDLDIQRKLQGIQASIRIGEEMKKLSIMEGMSLDDAYLKHGEEAYAQLDQKTPPWLAKKLESGATPSSSGADIDKEDEDLINKYKGK